MVACDAPETSLVYNLIRAFSNLQELHGRIYGEKIIGRS